MASTMSKKKPTSPPSDRHASTRMVRLPVELHDMVKALARRNRRSLTGEVMLALEAHLRAQGVEPPPMP